ncbi:MAG: hypothetical protein ACRD22_07100 [Terriglobia bacterium]
MNIEQTMQFILDMQAKHEAASQKRDEQIAENSRQLAENSRQIQSNTGMIRQLVDVSLSLAHHGEETDRRIRELAESQSRTDYKLNALIETVDKLVRRNGGAS